MCRCRAVNAGLWLGTALLCPHNRVLIRPHCIDCVFGKTKMIARACIKTAGFAAGESDIKTGGWSENSKVGIEAVGETV